MNTMCPNCRRLLRVDDRYAGDLIDCPVCGGTFQAKRVGVGHLNVEQPRSFKALAIILAAGVCCVVAIVLWSVWDAKAQARKAAIEALSIEYKRDVRLSLIGALQEDKLLAEVQEITETYSSQKEKIDGDYARAMGKPPPDVRLIHEQQKANRIAEAEARRRRRADEMAELRRRYTERFRELGAVAPAY
jgi:hypothetical protein